jgi:hypothetical protein
MLCSGYKTWGRISVNLKGKIPTLTEARTVERVRRATDGQMHNLTECNMQVKPAVIPVWRASYFSNTRIFIVVTISCNSAKKIKRVDKITSNRTRGGPPVFSFRQSLSRVLETPQEVQLLWIRTTGKPGSTPVKLLQLYLITWDKTLQKFVQ